MFAYLVFCPVCRSRLSSRIVPPINYQLLGSCHGILFFYLCSWRPTHDVRNDRWSWPPGLCRSSQRQIAGVCNSWSCSTKKTSLTAPVTWKEGGYIWEYANIWKCGLLMKSVFNEQEWRKHRVVFTRSNFTVFMATAVVFASAHRSNCQQVSTLFLWELALSSWKWYVPGEHKSCCRLRRGKMLSHDWQKCRKYVKGCDDALYCGVEQFSRCNNSLEIYKFNGGICKARGKAGGITRNYWRRRKIKDWNFLNFRKNYSIIRHYHEWKENINIAPYPFLWSQLS